MGKNLVIAEKSSVGREIAAHLGCRSRKDGYIEGDDWVVSWCAGHLVTLCMPDEYDHGWDKWSIDTLPMIPDRSGWKWKASARGSRGGGKTPAQQLKVLRELASRSDVDTIYNACDPDREGEGIFRRVQRYCGFKKPCRRLWVASLTDKALGTAFRNAKDAREYDGLGAAAECRAKADWLIGMNATRAYTTLAHEKRSVGRVRTPTLALVVQRDCDIENFVTKPFWRVILDLGDMMVTGEKMDDQARAKALAVACKGSTCHIDSVERKHVKTKAPTLLNTTAMQKEASKVLGLTPDACDAALQELYEAKLGSYPRTSSKYVCEADLPDVERLIKSICGIKELRALAEASGLLSAGANVKPLACDKKVEGHTALLPTENLDQASWDKLTGNARGVMAIMCSSLIAATSPAFEHDTCSVKATCEGEPFTARSDTPTFEGWKAVEATLRKILGAKAGKEEKRNDDGDEDVTIIPKSLVSGDVRTVSNASLKEGKSAPPKPFTDATLLDAMEHVSRYVEDKAAKEALSGSEVHAAGLGTDATRARTIASLVELGYLTRKGKQLRSTPAGRTVIDAVCDDVKSPVLTADMEGMLTKVEHDEMSSSEYLDAVERLVSKVVDSAKATPAAKVSSSGGTEVGTCPVCGAKVTCGKSIIKCERQTSAKDADGNWVESGDCSFKVFRKVCGKTLTESQAKALLAGKTVKMKGLTSKAGKKFDAGVKLDCEDGRWTTKLVFDKKKQLG